MAKGIFDMTHQTALTADFDDGQSTNPASPEPRMNGDICVVVDSSEFNTYIAHNGKWYGPMA